MAVQVHDHIHLGTDNPPTNTYKVRHGSLDATPGVTIAFDRGLTGELHVHRLLDGSGLVVQFCADKMQVRVTTAEMIVLKALIGKQVYYVANYHDDAAIGTWPTSAYVKRCILACGPGAITNFDPHADYWLITFNLVDSGTVT